MINELCISGGSHRGIAFIGSLKCLEDNKLLDRHKLKKVVGVSISSLILFLYLIGYELDVIMNKIIETDLSQFQDIQIQSYSILNGEKFRKWMYDFISTRIDPTITFLEFKNKYKIDLIISITSLDDGIIYANFESKPTMKIYDAIVASMNLPFIFPPYNIDDKLYIDGGILDNFPMHLLDIDGFGIRIEKQKKIELNMFNYPLKLFNIVRDYIDKISKTNHKNIITIFINDANVLNFNLNIDDKITLYRIGYDETYNSEIFNRYKHKELYKDVLTHIIKV